MNAFWLVLTYDLLEDRRIDDDSARFKFDFCVILWTNHNSLLSMATNQFASFCIGNTLRQSATFASVKVAKFEIKRLFPVYFNSLLYKTNRFLQFCRASVPCSRHLWSPLYYWADTRQHGIYLLNFPDLFTMLKRSTTKLYKPVSSKWKFSTKLSLKVQKHRAIKVTLLPPLEITWSMNSVSNKCDISDNRGKMCWKIQC